MTQFISPGTYVQERDLSSYVSNLSSTIVAMVGTADMGPVNSPTLITSPAQFVSTFGDPNPNHYLGYSALAYLKQGSILYVTRVAPSDSSVAKLTVPLPATSTPYTGAWTLTSNTATTATFLLANATGATGANQLVALPATPTVSLPGFDFTDVTNVAAINGKLGSDLLTLATVPAMATSYLSGRSFSITSGIGKGSSVPVTGATNVGTTGVSMTVDATQFNSFNSPLVTPATGSLVMLAAATFAPATAVSLVTLGATSASGTITLKYSGVLATTTTPTIAQIDTYISATSPNVTITIPLYYTGTAILAADAANNATLIANVLTGIITALRNAPTVPLLTNLSTAAPLIEASFNGIVGIGYVNTLTGASQGLKSATVLSDGVTISLAAITLGASGNYTYVVSAPTVLSATNMAITGNFALNLSRPTWVMNTAGSSFVPTYLKFTSDGQADFSNIAITIDLNPSNVSALNVQQYTVSLYVRNTGLNVPVNSVVQSNFSLAEQYVGTPEVLQSLINANSAYVNLKLDYSTVDTLSYTTGGIVYGAVPDYLTPSFALAADFAGTGVLTGTINTVSGTSLLPSYSAFMLGGSVGTSVNKYDIIGSTAAKTGLSSVADPEAIDINLLVVPGWSADPDVANGMISLCTNRADCMCILDTPFGLSVQDVIAYRNNVLPSGSNYAAIYYPWVQIVDSVNQKNIFVPPSGMVAAQYAYNDSVGDVFTAPAGRNRGNLLDATAVERILNQGDRDALTLAQINPIYSEAGYGIYIRGQMTLQQATTALNRVNIRRLLINLRKVIATASKYFEFEPGDSITALRLKQLAESTLEDRKRKGAIRSYTVDVGPDVNTAQVLDNNQLVMSISLIPVKTAEIIVEVFNILPQGQGISINNA